MHVLELEPMELVLEGSMHCAQVSCNRAVNSDTRQMDDMGRAQKRIPETVCVCRHVCLGDLHISLCRSSSKLFKCVLVYLEG